MFKLPDRIYTIYLFSFLCTERIYIAKFCVFCKILHFFVKFCVFCQVISSFKFFTNSYENISTKNYKILLYEFFCNEGYSLKILNISIFWIDVMKILFRSFILRYSKIFFSKPKLKTFKNHFKYFLFSNFSDFIWI